MVLSRAIVSDKCNAVESAKVFSQLMLVMGLAPILAPMLGRCAGQHLRLARGLPDGGRHLGLPESMPASTPLQPLSGAFRQYANLFKDGVFIGHALTGGIAMAGMFAYVAGSPFVFIKLYGVPAEHYGWLFGMNAAGFILVAQINARILRKTGPAFLLSRTVHVPAHRSALAVTGAAVHLRGEPGLHHSQCVSLCHERPVGAGGQCVGVAGLLAIQRCRRCCESGGATPMALVISLCGVLTVGISVLTRRAQGQRDGHPDHLINCAGCVGE